MRQISNITDSIFSEAKEIQKRNSSYERSLVEAGVVVESGEDYRVLALSQQIENQDGEVLYVDRIERDAVTGEPGLRFETDGFTIPSGSVEDFYRAVSVVALAGRTTDDRTDKLIRQANAELLGQSAVTTARVFGQQVLGERLAESQNFIVAAKQAVSKIISGTFGDLSEALKEQFGYYLPFFQKNSELTTEQLEHAVIFSLSDEFQELKGGLNENSSQAAYREAFAETPIAEIFDTVWENSGCSWSLIQGRFNSESSNDIEFFDLNDDDDDEGYDLYD